MAEAEFSLGKEVNWPDKSVGEMSDLEKKHSPRIECPDSVKAGEPFEVRIVTGKLMKHPNEYDHFIMWSELYANDRFLGRVTFAPVSTEPEVTFKIKLDESVNLIAYEMCNLHGLWKNVVPIDVK
ncbi:MAG: class II SORL domain-containing protein [Archaeoglobaceae archaeon]